LFYYKHTQWCYACRKGEKTGLVLFNENDLKKKTRNDLKKKMMAKEKSDGKIAELTYRK